MAGQEHDDMCLPTAKPGPHRGHGLGRDRVAAVARNSQVRGFDDRLQKLVPCGALVVFGQFDFNTHEIQETAHGWQDFVDLASPQHLAQFEALLCQALVEFIALVVIEPSAAVQVIDSRLRCTKWDANDCTWASLSTFRRGAARSTEM